MKDVLRGVSLPAVALCCLVACTKANPAYHEDLPTPDAGESAMADAGAVAPDARATPDAPPAPDGPAAPDTARPVDLGSAADTDEGAGAFGIVAVDSLAVDRDGTLYFDQNDGTNVWIGRRHPMQSPEPHWVSVPMGFPTRGMAIDSGRRVLYFTANSDTGAGKATVLTIDVDGAAPAPRVLSGGFTNPNDLAVGSDGGVYLSEQADGHIYRLSPSGARTKVTKTAIGDPVNMKGPAGLAFGPDGWLYVGAQQPGPITRLHLMNGVEVERGTYGSQFTEWGNGLAFDQAGRLYVALYSQQVMEKVVRLDSDTAAPVPQLTGKWFSGMAFGRGALDARWLFVAEPDGPLHRLDTDVPGLPVP